MPNLLHSALTGQSDSDSKQERGFHRYNRFCPFIHIMAALFLVSVFTYLRHIISVCVFLLSFKRSKRADPLQSFNSLKDTFSLQNLYSHFHSSYPWNNILTFHQMCWLRQKVFSLKAALLSPLPVDLRSPLSILFWTSAFQKLLGMWCEKRAVWIFGKVFFFFFKTGLKHHLQLHYSNVFAYSVYWKNRPAGCGLI